MISKLARSLALLVAALVVATPAAAQQVEDDAAPRAERWPASSGSRTVAVDLGLRTAFVRDAGFDPYSSNDVLNQGSLGASATVFRRGALSLAVGGRWEWGAASASARGADAKLWTHRLSLPVEVRWELERPLYVFARVAAGALYEGASLADGSSLGTLTSSGWVPTGDASLGAAFLLGPYHASPRMPRWWLVGDGGYGLAARRDVRLTAEAPSGEPRSFGAIDLPSVAVSGGFVRLAVATTF